MPLASYFSKVAEPSGSVSLSLSSFIPFTVVCGIVTAVPASISACVAVLYKSNFAPASFVDESPFLYLSILMAKVVTSAVSVFCLCEFST